ncbi:DUF2790 domain-containing protein [Pseudomonas sp. 5P_3.1_Bac2]|uniref:DUF2790 domain-containing protein n=1 Tax=Pseudomonas sp. 5P_3.1_Bac2 TaxID=2971617 RepID=UPI0021CA9F71|nr:DUF2790 domain-containing protein [Pseudomonas sp. 5P_3.1_Bac2]MCU1717912.1 DUF2790 domain-containing protein [Pseudomonas sp. 5P_3.1_Bac2]
MKLFKALVACSLVMLGSQMALADQAVVEQYHYGTHLDVAKVLHRDDTPTACGVAPVQMIYLDHQGQQHTVQYLVVGNGCFDN